MRSNSKKWLCWMSVTPCRAKASCKALTSSAVRLIASRSLKWSAPKPQTAEIPCLAHKNVRIALSEPEEFLNGEKLEMKEGALVLKKDNIVSKKHVAFDSAKPGVFTFEYKLANGAKPVMFYAALDTRDAKNQKLSGSYIFGFKETETELAASTKKSDRVIKLKDGSRWQKPEYRRGVVVVAFNAKEDGSDLPNHRLRPVKNISPDGEVTLRSPVGAAYPAGTRVRLHRDTCSFGIGSTYLRPTAEWKKCTIEIRPRTEGDAGSWWPFAKTVGVLFGLRGSDPEAGVMIRNIEFSQE